MSTNSKKQHASERLRPQPATTVHHASPSPAKRRPINQTTATPDLRKRIFEIIEVAKKADVVSRIYDIFLIVVIIVSLIPLVAPLAPSVSLGIQTFALVVFIGDYLLRWLTADYKYKTTSRLAFLRYPFSLPAIINLLVIISLSPLPSLCSSLAGVVESFRVIRICQVFRLSKYSRSINLILKVFRRQKNALITVMVFTLFYIFVAALAVHTAEPETFTNFFDAVYWAAASLTSIGFGDIYPISVVGRVITVFSSLFGVLVVALPTGIITAGYVKVANEQKRANKECCPVPPPSKSDSSPTP